MYIILLKHKVAHEELDKYKQEHVAYIKEFVNNGYVVAAGRCTSGTGGVIIVNFNTEQEVHDFEKEEPFYKNGLADYEVISFVPRSSQPGFETYISEADKMLI